MNIGARGVIYGLSAIVVASFAVDSVLARQAVGYVEASDAIRLDPAGLKVYASDRAKPSAGDRPLVFFGDSRAYMWSEPTAATGYRVVNRGIGRQTTAQMLLRFDAEVPPLHPAVIVLEAGVNDLKSIADFPERRAEIIADCKANLNTLVDRSRQTGAEVVLVTVFDIGDVPFWRRALWSNDVETAVREVNAFLPQLTGDKAMLFDANAILDDRPGEIRHEYQVDHLHLTPAGYAALNDRLVPLVRGLPK